MSGNDMPIGGYTEGELKFASFWVRHGLALKNAARWIVIVLNVAAWGYAAWTLVDIYALSYPRESRLQSDIARNQLAVQGLQADAPERIRTETVAVFAGTDGRLDMAVDAHNANAQWWAEFTYAFNVAGEQTPRRRGFILPESSMVLTELGFRPSAPGGRVAELVVEDIRWHRVDPAQVGGRFADFRNDHFAVVFEDVTFDRVTAGAGQISRTAFNMVNRGAFGFWSVDLVVRLKRGGGVLAVNRITVAELRPGESRHVELQWFESLPPVTETEIIPVVNLLDPAVYLPTERF